MIVRLKGGLTLSLPDTTPLPFDQAMGYFVLNGFACDNPDLGITPAFYALAQTRTEAYELHQYELVLGRPEDICE